MCNIYADLKLNYTMGRSKGHIELEWLCRSDANDDGDWYRRQVRVFLHVLIDPTSSSIANLRIEIEGKQKID